MSIESLFNTTMQCKVASRTELSGQPVETIGSAGSSVGVRIEHVEDIPTETPAGLIAQAIYIIYFASGTTVKERDIWVDDADAAEYRIISVAQAYGMSAIDHVEARAVKVM